MSSSEFRPATYFGYPQDDENPEVMVGTSCLDVIVEMTADQFAPIIGPRGGKSEAEIKGQSAVLLGKALNMVLGLGFSREESAEAFSIGMRLGQEFKGRYRVAHLDESINP